MARRRLTEAAVAFQQATSSLGGEARRDDADGARLIDRRRHRRADGVTDADEYDSDDAARGAALEMTSRGSAARRRGGGGQSFLAVPDREDPDQALGRRSRKDD